MFLRKDIHPSLKNGLYYFNSDFGIAYVHRQQKIYRGQVDQRVQTAVKTLFASLAKYNPEQMKAFQQTAAYTKLDEQRMAPSKTINERSVPSGGIDRGSGAQHRDAWRKVNQTYLANGLQASLTKELIIEINSEFREPLISGKKESTGFRQPHQECSDAYEERYYTPGSAVELEMTEAIRDINKEIEACEKGSTDPISVAAGAYQKLVSIHACYDGNGRTCRFIADLILRRFQLLPGSWASEEETYNVAINPISEVSSTPTKAVELMMQAVQRSYALVS